MHVDSPRSQHVRKDGSVREYQSHLLRRSYRDEAGRPRKETLANLSALPDAAVAAVRKVLAGAVLVGADEVFEVARSVPHGDVAAVHAVATRLGLRKLLGPACRERELAYALVLSRVVRPASKLSTTTWWADSTLGEDLGVAGASTDEVYHAMDWLLSRQDDIEAALAARHLRPGGIAMFDLSSSWVEGACCELAAFGHSRDGKKGLPQIEYGLLTGPEGQPVAIRVFPGNTTDSESFVEAITTVRDKFGLTELVLVGDRGMLTKTRIDQLRELDGMDWISALRAPAIAKLAAADGPLQMSLFDTQNFAEIIHPDYPDERLICCHNPALAAQRAHKRESLLSATERELTKVAARAGTTKLTGADTIGVAAGKVLNKYKVAKHFTLQITDTSFSYHRDQTKIDAEAHLDGIYVIRTSLAEQTMNPAQTITAYKNLKFVEANFAVIKVDDLDLRPIFHYRSNRVRAHVFICMLAAHLVWHLRRDLAPLTFTDQHIPPRDDPVAPATRSKQAKTKDRTKKTPDGLQVRSFPDLLDHLGTLNRQTVTFAGQHIKKITTPTPTQRRAFELLGVPIPLTLT